MFPPKNMINSRKLSRLMIIANLVMLLTYLAVILFIQNQLIDLFKYLLFNIFYILLPGRLIVSIIKLDSEKSRLRVTLYSMALGVVVLLISYFIFYGLNIRECLIFSGPAYSLVLLVKILRQKHDFHRCFRAVDQIAIFYTFLIILLSLFGLTLINLLPDMKGISSINQDILWNIGNSEAFVRSFPAFDSRMSGVVFYYHYFAPILKAVASIITGISVSDIYFAFSPITFVTFLILSIIDFGRILFKSKLFSYFNLFALIFNGCGSLLLTFEKPKGLFLNSFVYKLLYLPNGIDLATPVMVVLVILLIEIYRKNQLSYGDSFAVFLLIALLTGSKAPFGLMMIGIIFVIFLIQLIRKLDVKLHGLIFLIGIIAFTIIYFQCVRSPYGDDSISFIPGETISSTPIGAIVDIILPLIDHSNNPNVVSLFRIILVPMHFIAFLPFASTLFILWSHDRLRNWQRIKAEELLLGGLAMGGLLSFYIFSIDGKSQLYFAFGAIPFVYAGAMIWLEENIKSLKKYTFTIICVLFLLAATTSISMHLGILKDGIRSLQLAVFHYDSYAQPDTDALTATEYEGIRWLKNNVRDDEIIAVDRHYTSEVDEAHIPSPNDSARYFYYSAFSGKQIFLEGWAYTGRNDFIRQEIIRRNRINDQIYTASNFNIDQILLDNNIKFIVVSRATNPNVYFENDDLVLVFANRDIKIYEFEKSIGNVNE